MNADTICALSTAPGGALAIIRVSGQQAFPIVSSLCSVCCGSAAAANTIHYTHIKSGTEIIDECMVSVFRAPHSYTGEDSVEITCHGSRYILNKVLDLLIEQGCRMAAPGEYTMRAYLNGKMDLSQAEAVADLIASTNRATHQMALSQLRGGFSSELAQLRSQLLKLTSLLELELDFSDHEDLEFADRHELLELAKDIDSQISRLAHTFETGQALKEGIPVAIVGKTNVGKSTLLNRLLKDDRAIVSDIHGTTRDTIEETININGVTFRIIDTAGIRQATDAIEQIGIERTYAAINKARVVLWLLDAAPTEAEIHDMTTRTKEKKLLIAINKADTLFAPPSPSPLTSQPTPLTPPYVPYAEDLPQPSLPISAKPGLGIEALEAAIYSAADLPEISDTDTIVSNARHYDALCRAHENLQHVINDLSPLIPHSSPLTSHPSSPSTDLIAEDLKAVLNDLSEITGENRITPQETLNNIFSHFCIGK